MRLRGLTLGEKKVLHGRCGTPYLVRYTLVETPWFSIKLHHILRSDEDPDCHDHPWSFLSIILWGGYFEWTPHLRQGWPLIVGAERGCHYCDNGNYRYVQHNHAYHLTSGGSKLLCTAYTGRKNVQWYGPGRVLWRPAPWPHLLELPKGRTTWSLVFMSGRRRQWGFRTPKGWVGWMQYLAQRARTGGPC